MFPFEVSLSSKSLDHTGHHRENTSLTVQVWKMVIKVKIITRAEFNLLISHTSGGSFLRREEKMDCFEQSVYTCLVQRACPHGIPSVSTCYYNLPGGSGKW